MTVDAASLVSGIAPPGVACAEFEDAGQALALRPEDAIHVAKAVDSRRRDFAAGRLCARAALARLGLADAMVDREADGRPVWPAGFVGSITHTKGYAAALAARSNDFLGVGLDAERAGRVTGGMMRLLFTPPERAWLERCDPEKQNAAATIFFSAKEAYYKAWNPIMGRPLSFLAVQVELEEGGFVVTQPDAILEEWRKPIRGRLAMRGDLVITAVCLPAPAP